MSNIPGQLPYSNPNKIVTGSKGAIFRRNGDKFTVLRENQVTVLDLSKKSFLIHYKNDILKTQKLDDADISFEKSTESWIHDGIQWKYIGDQDAVLTSTDQAVPRFFMDVSKQTYKQGVSSSYTVSVIYTGSYYTTDVFVVEISSSKPNWFYSGSKMVTTGSLGTTPVYGDTSVNGSPWGFSYTSGEVATSSLMIFTTTFLFDATASLQGDVTFHGDLYLESALKNSHKFVVYSGSL